MATVVVCPGCGNKVKLGRDFYDPFENGVGCMNVEEHDSDEVLVMYES